MDQERARAMGGARVHAKGESESGGGGSGSEGSRGGTERAGWVGARGSGRPARAPTCFYPVLYLLGPKYQKFSSPGFVLFCP